MEEMRKKEITNMNAEKLNWEPPKLISLDKGKTEGGVVAGVAEDDSYSGPGTIS